jgi:hypothetical protein
VQPQLERIEVEAVRRGDDDLAVDDAALGERFKQRIMQFWEIAVERPQVAALYENVCCAAKDDRPEAVPFGLEEECTLRRQLVGQLGEHRLDRRGDAVGVTHCHEPSDDRPPVYLPEYLQE